MDIARSVSVETVPIFSFGTHLYIARQPALMILLIRSEESSLAVTDAETCLVSISD